MPRMQLEGSSSIVTGGASGIGEASARQLAAAGSRVVIADINEDDGQAVASSIGGIFVKCDVSSTVDADAAVTAASGLAPLRALVNSAGLAYAARTINRENEPMDLDRFTFVIQVNLVGSFNMLSRAAAEMATTDPLDEDGSRGAIVNMASAAAFDGQIGQAAYAASKGGIIGLSNSMAVHYGRNNIRVNCIAPGHIHSPMVARHSTAEMLDLRRRAGPLGTEGTPWDVAWASLFLASDEARWISGVTLPVDAGLLAATPLAMFPYLRDPE